LSDADAGAGVAAAAPPKEPKAPPSHPMPAVRLRAPGETDDGRLVDAVALLDAEVDLDDEVRTPRGWMAVAEALDPALAPPGTHDEREVERATFWLGPGGGRALPEPVRYTMLLAWMTGLLEGLWMLRPGPKMERLELVAAALVALVLLLKRFTRWGMAFCFAVGVGAAARGLFDAARARGTGLPWGGWLWIVAPAAVGAGLAALAVTWVRRAPDAQRPGWRLLRVAHGPRAVDEARRARAAERFRAVPFGVAAAGAAVAVPYAVFFVTRASSTVLFPLLLAAGGASLLVWARVARKTPPAALGLGVARLRGDLAAAAAALGLLFVGAQAAFSVMDAVQWLLHGLGAAGAAGAVDAASRGMADTEAASSAAIAAGATWRLYAVGALAAVGEELAFRGGLYAALRRRLAVWPALAVTAVPFALLHFEPYQSAQLLVGGVVLGALYEWRRTLWAPIALHLGWNLLIVFLTS
jgi:membrane protease YdiL (CAAX protease family)